MKIKYIKIPQVFKVGDKDVEQVAKKFGVSLLELKKYNNVENLHKGTLLAIPKQQSKTNQYVVKPADTLEKISYKLGVNKQILQQKNNVNKIFIGQILYY